MSSVSGCKAIVMALAVGVINVATGLSIQVRETPQPLNPPSFDNWNYLGCYSDTQASRTLAIAAHFGEHVDDDNCIYQCIQLGHIFAGVEYSGQCYCGDYVNPVATKQPESECYMPCTKTATQACGGPGRMNLYNLIGANPATPPAEVTTNSGVNSFILQGCYSDSVGARTLANTVGTTGGGAAMTVALCVDACHNAGYILAGAEYGGQCYCDNTFINGGPFSSLSNCNMACNGNSSEFCGGPGALNMYSYQGTTPVSSTVVVSTPTPVTSVSLPSSWETLGCFTDNVGSRALTHDLNIPSLTIEKCINGCANAGFTVAGVEYGGECYCDSKIQNNQGQASDGSAGCNMGCSGNAGETCGGPNRLNVFAAGSQWLGIGCFTDQTYSRTLTTVGKFDGLLTIEKCLASCHAAGYKYAGAEYSKECYCSNSFSNGGTVAPDGNAGCSWTCEGDNSQICGGNSRLSIYEYIGADGISVPPPASTSTAISSTSSIIAGVTPFPTLTASNSISSSTTQTSTPSGISKLPPGWSYHGCWAEGTNGRILAHQESDSSNNTIESCISACSGMGMTLAGLEYSSQWYVNFVISQVGAGSLTAGITYVLSISPEDRLNNIFSSFCDNFIRNNGMVSSADSNCAMKCSGNDAETCGGGGLVSLYSSATPGIAPIPAIKKTGLPGTWIWKGCFSDQIGQRDLGDNGVETESLTLNSADYCLEYCFSQGFDAAGTEYSKQCFCGHASSFIAVNPTLLDDSHCNMICTGNETQTCGGAGALAYYALE